MSETRYDLHSHSAASDGSLSPSELVARAQAAGVGVLALTDHDTLAGVSEAREAARGGRLRVLPGVEVSVTWRQRTVHVVGLGVDVEDDTLQQGLVRLRRFRAWRAEEIGRRLAAHGIPGAYEGARARARGGLISRTHFAHFLVAGGHAPTPRKVFERFLVRNRPGHVPGQWASLEEAVSWIRGAGGQAVLAHPARYGLTRTRLLELLEAHQEAGGEAMEVVSGSHSRDEVLAMAAHCRRTGLLASAGSDYHGPENPWIELGRLPPLPLGCVPVWAGWPVSAEA